MNQMPLSNHLGVNGKQEKHILLRSPNRKATRENEGERIGTRLFNITKREIAKSFCLIELGLKFFQFPCKVQTWRSTENKGRMIRLKAEI